MTFTCTSRSLLQLRRRRLISYRFVSQNQELVNTRSKLISQGTGNAQTLNRRWPSMLGGLLTVGAPAGYYIHLKKQEQGLREDARDLETLSGKQDRYKNSTILMRLLRKNLLPWKSRTQ